MKFLLVLRTEVPEHSFSTGRELQEHFSPVTTVAPPPQIAPLGETLYQFDCAVVPDMQPLRDYTHPRTNPARQALQDQQHLLLPRFHSDRTCCLFVEMKIPSNVVAKLRETLILRQGERTVFHARNYTGAKPIFLEWGQSTAALMVFQIPIVSFFLTAAAWAGPLPLCAP